MKPTAHAAQQRRRAARLALGQRRLVEGGRREVEAHADRDDHQALAVVGELVAEGDLHQLGARRSG